MSVSNGDEQEDKGAKKSIRGEFLYNYYTFQSVHESNHGAIRIFVGLSHEL